jgi:hypothetical protein
MEWIEIETGSRFRQVAANGGLHAYQVFSDSHDTVRLTRWMHTGTLPPDFESASLFVLDVTEQASRNTIVFPMGRGPGRPGMEPELAALVETAKTYAERFEAGHDIDGYPHWQRRLRTTARFPATGDANDCPNC